MKTEKDHDDPRRRPEDELTLPLFEEPQTELAEATKPQGNSPKRRDAITPEERAQILRLHGQGLGTRPIARTLSRSRTTVQRVLREAGQLELARPSEPIAPRAKSSKLDPFRERIKEKAEQGLTTIRILRELRESGYTGGRTILANYVRTLRAPLAPRARKVTKRFETEKGQETQVDWSTYRVELGGRVRTIQALAMVLGHSRFAFLRYYASQRQPVLLEALGEGFRHFQGVTRETIYDNMATVVLGRVGRDRKPLWNPELVAFSEHYGTEPKLCRVRHPDRKGEVEAFLGYSERDFLRGRTAESLVELNRQAERWLCEIANRREHGTTGRIPEEAWEEEKPFLIALPETTYPGACRVEYRSVAEDCTISVQGTRYTVPARLAHRQVRVRLYAERFQVMDPQGGIAFERDYAVGQEAKRLQLEPSHYDDLPQVKANRSGKTKRLKDQLLARWPELEDFLDGVHARSKGLLHVHLRRLLRLAKRYGDEALRGASLRAHQAGLHTSQSVERILVLEHGLPTEEPLPLPSSAAGQAMAQIDDLDEEASLDSYGYLDGADVEGGNDEQ
jgi:transposase